MQIAFAHQQSQQQVIRQIILTPENDEDEDLLEELDLHRDYRIRLVKGKIFKTQDEEKREYESLYTHGSRKCGRIPKILISCWNERDTDNTNGAGR